MHGESGSGKTSILAKAASLTFDWLKKKELVVGLRFLGTTPSSSSVAPLLMNLCEQFAYNYDQPRDRNPNELSQLFLYFKRLMEFATKERPLVVFLDSLDLLSTDDGAHELLWFPIQLPPDVKLVASVTPSRTNVFATLQRIVEQQKNYLLIKPLGMDLSIIVIQEWLKSGHRTLTCNQWEIVKEALAKCNLPIFVKLVHATVCQWKSYSK